MIKLSAQENGWFFLDFCRNHGVVRNPKKYQGCNIIVDDLTSL